MKNSYSVPGIPDEAFERRPGVPMTKNEIRILSLARLCLYPEAVVFDIGAGTGSVAIECRLLAPLGRVYAIERNPAALDLIRVNSETFGVDLQIIAGLAPRAIDPLEPADRIFIGGSGGSIETLIAACDEKLKPGGIIVVNTVTMFNGPAAYMAMEKLGYTTEAIQVNIAVNEVQGPARIWQARNPVMIITGRKGDRQHGLG